MHYQYTTERSLYFHITLIVVFVLRKYEENLQYTKKPNYNIQKQEIRCFVTEKAKLILLEKNKIKMSMCTINILLNDP